MQLKTEQTTKTPRNTPKAKKMNETTPKQGKQQQLKTPQSKKNMPKTPESDPKKGMKNSPSNKKQKLDSNKGISTKKSSLGIRARVSIPPGQTVEYKDLQKIFDGCENVVFPLPVVIQYNKNVISNKVQELKKLIVNGKRLIVTTNDVEISLIKKTMRLRDTGNQKMNSELIEKARKFFNAKSIENLGKKSTFGKSTNTYLLTFETESKAAAASEKKFKYNDSVIELAPYFEGNAANGKVVSAKPEQTKRKAEEDEEESDEEEEDYGDVEMDDDDDDDDE